MASWLSTETRVVVQGLTGREGKFHALAGRDYGTKVVAGVTPGKGGTDVEGIPVFNTVHEAVEKTGANASLLFVPPRPTGSWKPPTRASPSSSRSPKGSPSTT